MSGNRKLSIGITINLENYENLRLEIEGEVATENDADELVSYLDGILSRLGRNDPGTADRVDSYRRRVLEMPADFIVGGQESVSVAGDTSGDDMHAPSGELKVPETESVSGGAVAYIAGAGTAGIAVVSEDPEEIVPDVSEISREPVVGVDPGQSGNKDKKKSSEETFSCSSCGVMISGPEERLSQLFVGRPLCKRCLNALQE
ncbi:MAG: hypothetical protein U9N40_07480 [Euryarchaeota archaeon]|nr:hypothetical protein [Euryarchaeota archaeon]